MNKTELVRNLAIQTNLTRKEANFFLNAFVETVQDSLSKGEKVSISKLGTFHLASRKGFTSMHPRTRQKIQIPAQIIPLFKPSGELKKIVKSI